LRKKDLELQESLIKFNKFLQEVRLLYPKSSLYSPLTSLTPTPSLERVKAKQSHQESSRREETARDEGGRDKKLEAAVPREDGGGGADEEPGGAEHQVPAVSDGRRGVRAGERGFSRGAGPAKQVQDAERRQQRLDKEAGAARRREREQAVAGKWS